MKYLLFAFALSLSTMNAFAQPGNEMKTAEDSVAVLIGSWNYIAHVTADGEEKKRVHEIILKFTEQGTYSKSSKVSASDEPRVKRGEFSLKGDQLTRHNLSYSKNPAVATIISLEPKRLVIKSFAMTLVYVKE